MALTLSVFSIINQPHVTLTLLPILWLPKARKIHSKTLLQKVAEKVQN